MTEGENHDIPEDDGSLHATVSITLGRNGLPIPIIQLTEVSDYYSSKDYNLDEIREAMARSVLLG